MKAVMRTHVRDELSQGPGAGRLEWKH
eukprot:COSAG01_NODE_43155_length_432_cov_4.669670_1_plen_26_part_10